MKKTQYAQGPGFDPQHSGREKSLKSNESKGNEAQTLEINPTVERAGGLFLCVSMNLLQAKPPSYNYMN